MPDEKQTNGVVIGPSQPYEKGILQERIHQQVVAEMLEEYRYSNEKDRETWKTMLAANEEVETAVYKAFELTARTILDEVAQEFGLANDPKYQALRRKYCPD